MSSLLFFFTLRPGIILRSGIRAAKFKHSRGNPLKGEVDKTKHGDDLAFLNKFPLVEDQQIKHISNVQKGKASWFA